MVANLLCFTVLLDATVAALTIIFSIRIPSWLLPFLYYIQVSYFYKFDFMCIFCEFCVVNYSGIFAFHRLPHIS